MRRLKKKGVRDNTLIFFTSDNGGLTNALFATCARSPAEHAASGGLALGAKLPASNALFKGGKAGLHEGGVRVPAFFNWPGRLAPAVVNEPLHHFESSQPSPMKTLSSIWNYFAERSAKGTGS